MDSQLDNIDKRVRAAARIHYKRMHDKGDGPLPDEYALGASVTGEEIFARLAGMDRCKARNRALDIAFEEKEKIDRRELNNLMRRNQ